MAFVLIETAGSKRWGKQLYFARMTAIGPMTTPALAEAAVFGSEDEAKRCPAYYFPLAVFKPAEHPDPGRLAGELRPDDAA